MDLSSKNIIIVAHESFSLGPAHELKNFLLKYKVSDLIFITHPLLYFKDDFKKSSHYTIYKKGEKQREKTGFHWALPMPLLFLKDVFYTFFWCNMLLSKIDIFFGVDPLNAFVGILLKKIGRVKKVVYYSIDYSPTRFKNPILNYIYHAAEKFCCYYADIIWVGTLDTVAQWKKNGFKKNKLAPIVVVPDGNHAIRNLEHKPKRVKKFQLVYIGYLAYKQGIDLALDSFSELTKKVKNITLIIIGTGEYELELKKKVKDLHLKNITFAGFIEDKGAEKIISESAVGLATYIPDKESFTFYSEAGKPKFYLGCGIPVIITNVPAIAHEINEEEAGIAIDYNVREFQDAVLKILDEKNYGEYRENAERMGLKFDWSIILKKALSQTLKI